MDRPTVGRIVHYQNLGDKEGRYPPETQAALITGVKRREEDSAFAAWDPDSPTSYIVDLHIFYRTGDFFMLDVPWHPEPMSGHWRWPERA